MSVSPHGMAIAGLQLLAMLAVMYAARRWPHKRPLITVAVLVEYAILRYQPIRMGGDGFAYSLGIFDAVTFLPLLFMWWQPTPNQGAAAGP